MGLDSTKLTKFRAFGEGWKARCPACAETGQDRKGEHLRISADGKFGCCVHAGDREHRKRIFALAGEHGAKEIRVRVATAKTAPSVQLDLLGRLGRVFSSAEGKMENGECQPGELVSDSGTVGTGTYSLRVEENDLHIYKLKGSETCVPSVPERKVETGVPGVPDDRNGAHGSDRPTMPHLLSDGTLRIPFNSPERYHWWKGGQSPRETRKEIMERKENDAAPF